VAIFDVEKINSVGLDATASGVVTSVCLPEVARDYDATVTLPCRRVVKHRYGCSGIDGVSIGPRFGKKKGKQYLTLAYGVFSDTTRTDNDYQVLLQFDIEALKRYEQPFSTTHTIGPKHCQGRYFVFTGNTTYGLQNLEYDAHSGLWLAAAYKGKKKHYPNFGLFAIDGAKTPKRQVLKGVANDEKGKVLSLAAKGNASADGAVRGWHTQLGTMGIISLGGGYYYVAHGERRQDGNFAVVKMYRFDADASVPFVEVK
jgi:hypothetical protein